MIKRRQAGSSTWSWIDGIILVGCLMVAAAALSAWRSAGLAGADDNLDTIYRLFALDAGWRAGLFFPRWSPDLAYGYGAPLFQYYPPLVSYLAEVCHLLGLGFLSAVKAAAYVSLALGGMGTYLLGRRLALGRPGAALAALAYMAAPYQMTNVYLRGAGAETLAWGLLPWVLWAFHALWENGRVGWLAGAGLLWALLLLTHNGIALFGFVLLLVYLIVLGAGRTSRRRTALLLAAIGLGLGLAAFFWLPALAERGYVNLAAMASDQYNPVQHLSAWPDLLQRTLTFDYARPQCFRWGLELALAAGLGVLLLPWQRSPWRRMAFFFAGVCVLGLALQAQALELFWTTAPLVSYLQFPWRLLGFVTLGGALLIGGIPDWVETRRPAGRRRAVWAGGVAVALGLGLAGAALPGAWQAYAGQERLSEEQIGREDMYARGRQGFELFSDYQPVGVQMPMSEVGAECSPAAAPEAGLAALPAVHVLRAEPLAMELSLDAPAAFTLSLHQFYFPGWQAALDGTRVPAFAAGERGLVAVDIPAGAHRLVLRFGATPLRAASQALSAASLLALGGLAAWSLRRRPGLLIAGVVLAASAALGWSACIPHTWPQAQEERTVEVGAGLRLLSYGMRPASLRAGESLHVTLYWLATGPGQADERVFVHLRDQADQRAWGQHDGRLAYGYTDVRCLQAGELVMDAHVLTVEKGAPAGAYLLVAGRYDPVTVQNVPVADSPWKLAGERVRLGTLDILP